MFAGLPSIPSDAVDAYTVEALETLTPKVFETDRAAVEQIWIDQKYQINLFDVSGNSQRHVGSYMIVQLVCAAVGRR